MSKFLLRTLLFFFSIAAVILIVNIFLWSGVEDDHSFGRFEKFEEAQLANKYSEFLRLDSANTFNTLFFGTSKIYRHLDPSLYDSVLQGETRSYNLAFGNLFPFRLYDALDAVLTAKKDKGIEVFIEIAPLAKVGENYDVLQIQNSVTIERLKISNNYLQLFENKRIVSAAFLESCNAFAWKYFSPALLKSYWEGRTAIGTWNKNAIQRNGFVPLELEKEEIIIQRHKPVDYPYPPQVDPLEKEDHFFDFMLGHVLSLKKIGLKNVYFVIPPRVYKGDHVFMATMKHKLEKKGFVVFDLSDVRKYPQFYKADLSYDRTHLNSDGARQFTMELAEAVRKYKMQTNLIVTN
jgi:hypothetical protein